VRLQPGTDPELFTQLGFHPGDMILNINGAAVTDPSMLSMLRSGRTVRVAVRRLTGTQTLSINTAALGGNAQD
jgi:type II secretory pathway component PulC